MTTWVKVYNSMPSHPKFLAVGERAAWLAVCGLCYANEHLTNGFIAHHVLPVVAPGVKAPEKLAQLLVQFDLWHVVEGGWLIHDYGEHQRSADEIRERRAKDAERKAAARSNGSPAGSPRGQTADSARIPSGVQGVDVEGRRQKAGEKELTPLSTLRADVAEIFAYWQEKCGHPNAKLTTDRRRKIEARLKEGYTVMQIRRAIDGAARAAFTNDDGKRFDDIELICRNGSKLESFIDRADAQPPGQVVQFGRKESPGALLRAINNGEAS